MKLKNIMSENLNKKDSILIIGAGISGLATAYKLLKLGFNVTVIEKQKMAGGISSSIEFEGCKLDIGPHILLLAENSEITNDIMEIVGNENLNKVKWPWAKSYVSDRIFEKSYPLLYDIFFNFGSKYFIKSIYSIISAKMIKLFKNHKIISAEDYFIKNYGKFLYHIWFKPYFSTQCENLSSEGIEFAKKKFHHITFKRFIVLLKRKIKIIIKTDNSREGKYDLYPKFGMIDLIQKMENKIQKQNGKFIFNADIISIKHDEKNKTIKYISEGVENNCKYDKIIYTTPISQTLKWFDKIPEKIEYQITKMKLFHSIMTFLIIDTPKLFDSWVITIYDNILKTVLGKVTN